MKVFNLTLAMYLDKCCIESNKLDKIKTFLQISWFISINDFILIQFYVYHKFCRGAFEVLQLRLSDGYF